MELYLINRNKKTDIKSPHKSEKISGLVKVVENIVNTLTDNTSNLIRTAGNCEEVMVYYSLDETLAKQQYDRIVSRTVAINGTLLAVNSAIVVCTYIPPLIFVPLISIPFLTLAINNYSVVAGAKKVKTKAEFKRHDELPKLEGLLKRDALEDYTFEDQFLQQLYTEYYTKPL